jgi:hypothetical protein
MFSQPSDAVHQRHGALDADAPADNLSDCFNFTQSPRGIQTIAAPLDAAHFLDDKRPPTDPDDD